MKTHCESAKAPIIANPTATSARCIVVVDWNSGRRLIFCTSRRQQRRKQTARYEQIRKLQADPDPPLRLLHSQQRISNDSGGCGDGVTGNGSSNKSKSSCMQVWLSRLHRQIDTRYCCTAILSENGSLLRVRNPVCCWDSQMHANIATNYVPNNCLLLRWQLVNYIYLYSTS